MNAGDIVRYGDGMTALVMLETPHAGGWHGRQCMGGTTYVHNYMRPASAEDLRTWQRCRRWRGETPVQSKPHLRAAEGGGWQCYDSRTSRVAATLAAAYQSHRRACA